jgi:hypothetical protein
MTRLVPKKAEVRTKAVALALANAGIEYNPNADRWERAGQLPKALAAALKAVGHKVPEFYGNDLWVDEVNLNMKIGHTESRYVPGKGHTNPNRLILYLGERQRYRNRRYLMKPKHTLREPDTGFDIARLVVVIETFVARERVEHAEAIKRQEEANARYQKHFQIYQRLFPLANQLGVTIGYNTDTMTVTVERLTEEADVARILEALRTAKEASQ